ncbi:MAG: hypothetical protein WDZ76_14015 [Pseudohongiellaceae bacterium]
MLISIKPHSAASIIVPLLLSGAFFSASLHAQDPEAGKSERVSDARVEVDSQDQRQLPDISRMLIIDRPQPVTNGIDPPFPDYAMQNFVGEPSEDDSALDVVDSIELYRQTVTALESDGGAWERSLAQELSSLGELYQQQGSHLEAADAFSRAMQVNRIHSGLYSLEQIPAVDDLIESHLALQNWEQADHYQNYLFHIQGRAYGKEDPRMIPAYERLANWNVRAFHLGVGDALGLRLANAYFLFESAARIVDIHFGKSDERFVSYLSEMADSAFLATRNRLLMVELDTPQYRTARDEHRSRLSETPVMHTQGYSEGEQALRDIIAYHASREGEELQLAEAVTQMGDWYLYFDRRRSATDRYQQAYEILESIEGEDRVARDYFQQVVPLPVFEHFEETLTLAASSVDRPLASGYADFLFTVTNYGVVTEIDVLTEETEENDRVLTRLRRELRDTRFRPIVIDGEAVTSEANHFRYRYWY